jgi:hypothetical protein
MCATPNLPDKALTYDRRPALKWRMVSVHKHHLHRRKAMNTKSVICFLKKLLCVRCASAVRLLSGGYWMGGIAIDVRRELPEEAVWTP